VHVLPDWRMVALRGVAALGFGLLTLVWPGLTLWSLVVLFGAYALVDGVVILGAAIANRDPIHRGRGWLVFDGVVGVAAGIVTFVWPDVTALALLFVIAAWAIITGVLEVATAIELRQAIHNEWLLALGGVASVVFGILLVITPGAGALVITWLIGWYALLFAAMLLSLAWRLHGIQTDAHGGATSLGPAAV